MIKHELALLETGCRTKEEFINAFYEKKPTRYNTSNIRIEYCDRCNSMSCDKCFIHECLNEIYKSNPFA